MTPGPIRQRLHDVAAIAERLRDLLQHPDLAEAGLLPARVAIVADRAAAGTVLELTGPSRRIAR